MYSYIQTSEQLFAGSEENQDLRHAKFTLAIMEEIDLTKEDVNQNSNPELTG